MYRFNARCSPGRRWETCSSQCEGTACVGTEVRIMSAATVLSSPCKKLIN